MSRKIRINLLEDFENEIDSHPFTGEKQLDPAINVKLRDLPDNWFNETSLLGTSKELFYNALKDEGIDIGKTYKCIGIYGFGDIFDLIIEINANKTEHFLSSVFEQIKEREIRGK